MYFLTEETVTFSAFVRWCSSLKDPSLVTFEARILHTTASSPVMGFSNLSNTAVFRCLYMPTFLATLNAASTESPVNIIHSRPPRRSSFTTRLLLGRMEASKQQNPQNFNPGVSTAFLCRASPFVLACAIHSAFMDKPLGNNARAIDDDDEFAARFSAPNAILRYPWISSSCVWFLNCASEKYTLESSFSIMSIIVSGDPFVTFQSSRRVSSRCKRRIADDRRRQGSNGKLQICHMRAGCEPKEEEEDSEFASKFASA
mmetsp:Transcript_11901/g.25212  ORF Transcript_11901/g.25212 Transcript_11901/m.25212 type:complete len:258 (-) Transcript_11901:290-1063(-)